MLLDLKPTLNNISGIKAISEGCAADLGNLLFFGAQASHIENMKYVLSCTCEETEKYKFEITN